MKQPFEKVVEEHGRTVLRVCRVILGVHDAEDAWSETFLAAMCAYPDLPDDANAEAWLVTIAHRKAIDVLRARKRQPAPVGELPEVPTALGLPGSAWPTRSKTMTACWTTWRSGSALACCGRRGGWMQRRGKLGEYFGGQRRAFDLPLDLSLSRGFRQLVQQHLPEIGYGQTCTYQQVAELVGNPRAVRAVGTACATSPLPVVVPCHRVLRADGTPGGYVGGPAAKQVLLSLEAAA
jgi:methylated-DNA-[protein]-cysteine S-methyltransferase